MKGILSSGAIPADLSVLVACSPRLAERLGVLDPQVELLTDDALSGSSWQQEVWRRRQLPHLLQKHRAEVLFDPGGLSTRSDRICVPRVTMSRNLLPFAPKEASRYPLLSRMRPRLYLLGRRQSDSFRRADGVIFLSHYAMEAVVSRVGELPQGVVIPHGVGEQFRSAPRERPLSESVRVLYVSTILPYKHQWHVLSAVNRVRRSTEWDVQIDLVGTGDRQGTRRLGKEIKKLGYPRWLRWRGWVAHEELPAVYRGADIFVFASSCETIGNILLEAMASGLPIACSDRRPMKDMLKDAGVYFGPENPNSIASALSQLIRDSELGLTCARRAYEYAQQYSWVRCAKETFGFLRAVASVRSSG